MRVMVFSSGIVMNQAGFQIIVPQCRKISIRSHGYAPQASGSLLLNRQMPGSLNSVSLVLIPFQTNFFIRLSVLAESMIRYGDIRPFWNRIPLFGSTSRRNHAGFEEDHAGCRIIVRVMVFSSGIVMNHAGFQIIVPQCRKISIRSHGYAPQALNSLLPQQADARFPKQCIFGFDPLPNGFHL